MKLLSVSDFAEMAITTQTLVFNQDDAVYDQRSVGQLETLMTRIKQTTLDPLMQRDVVLPLSMKLTSRVVIFDDDTPEARAEVDAFVVSSMKCGFVIAQAEQEFGWTSVAPAIDPKVETILAMTAAALVREVLRKNHHYLQGQLRVLSLYCGYLFGRFGEQRVSDEIGEIHTVLRLGPR